MVGYSEKLCDAEVEASLEPERMERDPDEAFQRAVLFPLLEMDTPSENVLLVVDSLDEPVAPAAKDLMIKRGVFMDDVDASDVSQSIAELLANHYHLLPPWIIPVLTLRRFFFCYYYNFNFVFHSISIIFSKISIIYIQKFDFSNVYSKILSNEF